MKIAILLVCAAVLLLQECSCFHKNENRVMQALEGAKRKSESKKVYIYTWTMHIYIYIYIYIYS